MQPTIVSPSEWVEARKQFLAKEKEFTRLRDELSRERRQLPWERVEKNYVFDGPNGKVKLADLFDGRSQLVVYHFMFGPDWEQGCPSCSFEADHFNAFIVHLNARDVSLIAVSRASFPKIEAFRKRMGWSFPWVSSNQNDFNRDYHVSFTKEEMAKGKVEYNYSLTEFPSEEAPGSACSTRMRMVTSSTPIPHTRAGSTSCWAPITISTWFPRAGTKMGCRSRCRGCGTTTSMRRVAHRR